MTNDINILHTNPWFSVHHRSDANTVGSAGWFRVARPDSVMVIAVLNGADLLFIRGQRDTVAGKARLEFPAGFIGPSENPEDAARREIREETGYDISNLRSIGSFVESPGISAAECHCFTATISTIGPASQEPGESWEAEFHTLKSVPRLITQGEIRDGSTLGCWALLSAQSSTADNRKTV
ncbi:NUDIX hydrolase [Lysinibacter sp. HNR]|uniref:NUDIX hydrolase n=1 Tax=Lysinibacter sp. HNR TaxID=3031408 RepID=UPI00243503CB|nr:NUDIX hydrolase [Lysinibacter sp. HNR]WGD37884.1 NUDIX hydrolase [Lysinibacter sp. HNR]